MPIVLCSCATVSLSAVQSVLIRLGIRLVIFIDDFDRIEKESTATEQAVAKALNQLQNLRHIQYIICVGSAVGKGQEVGVHRANWDLLKLTRFQELVPQLDPGAVMKHLSELRQRVLTDASLWLLWSEVEEGTSDPLAWYPEFGGVLSQVGLRRVLIGLTRTHRVLKAVLRETWNAWEGGLKGEIDWYDLILANALKAAEPAVFEWIAREPDLFLREPAREQRGQSTDQVAEAARRVRENLVARIDSLDAVHHQVVEDAVGHLFPAFREKLTSHGYVHGSQRQWSQRLCCCPNHGPTYLERFFHGAVPHHGVPDQPTLQFIRRLNHGSFDKAEFIDSYLSSGDRRTRELNKFVQFAGVIVKDAAWQVCDAMVEWLALPENGAEVQPNFTSYEGIMVDVVSILRDAGQGCSMGTRLTASSASTEDWILEKTMQNAGPAPFVAIELVEYACNPSFSLALPNTRRELADCLCREYVQGEKRFLPVLGQSRYALCRLVGALTKCGSYPAIKSSLTEKIVREADDDETHRLKAQVIVSLVHTRYPVGQEDNLENYEFSVDSPANEATYAMDVLRPAIIRWKIAPLSDKVADKAREYFITHGMMDRPIS